MDTPEPTCKVQVRLPTRTVRCKGACARKTASCSEYREAEHNFETKARIGEEFLVRHRPQGQQDMEGNSNGTYQAMRG